jgi:hypothetical protein
MSMATCIEHDLAMFSLARSYSLMRDELDIRQAMTVDFEY